MIEKNEDGTKLDRQRTDLKKPIEMALKANKADYQCFRQETQPAPKIGRDCNRVYSIIEHPGIPMWAQR